MTAWSFKALYFLLRSAVEFVCSCTTLRRFPVKVYGVADRSTEGYRKRKAVEASQLSAMQYDTCDTRKAST